GPPMALAYREAGGPRLRATLSAFFLVGSLLSLGMLAVAGEVTTDGLAAGAALVPTVGVGYALAEPLRHRLRRRGVREAVLAFSTVAATGLAVQAVLT
ncbi:MAG: sulfite exporter TauE/SafE family protein, partial [Kineosporiaceae bacterium]